jgi:phage terminase large subunit-like protein
LIIQTPDNNPILEYHAKIETGEIVVCKKIWRTYNHLAQKVLSNESEYYYNPERANHIITFFHKYLRHSKGKWGGKRINLELWQRALYAALYGFVSIEGIREYQRCVLIVGKKNGKSFMSSGTGLYGLTADGEPGPEIYSVATKRDQAKIIWDESRRMRNKSPALKSRIRATVAGLYFDAMDGIYKPLASDVNTMDGLNVFYALMDEFQQWVNGRALYDIIADGVSAREQPLIFMTSTAGTVREDIYDEIYYECESIINGYGDPNGYKDERTLPIIYELDKREEWTDPNCWIKGNPNLGVSKSVAYLTEKVERAKKNRNLVKNLLCKEFNIRETSTEAWLSYESCVNETTFDMDKVSHSYAIGGCDLSATTDLTCATLILQKPGDPNFYVLQKYFLPRARVTEVEENSKKEAPYELWAEQDWLHICESATVDYHAVTQWFVDMVQQYDIRPLWIAYDTALSGYWVPEMQEYGFEMEKIRQGPITWSYPMKRLGGLLEEHKIIYNNNPMLRWCLLNTKKKSTNENGIETIQPVKEKSTKRIDGMVSLLNAFVGYNNHEDEYVQYVR